MSIRDRTIGERDEKEARKRRRDVSEEKKELGTRIEEERADGDNEIGGKVFFTHSVEEDGFRLKGRQQSLTKEGWKRIIPTVDLAEMRSDPDEIRRKRKFPIDDAPDCEVQMKVEEEPVDRERSVVGRPEEEIETEGEKIHRKKEKDKTVPTITSGREPQLESVLLEWPREELLQEEKTGEEMETIKVARAGTPDASRGGLEGEEIPEYLDLIFHGGVGGKIESGKPIVIFLDELKGNGHIVALREICKRIYREKKGGKPKPLIITDSEELKKELRWLEAKDNIFSVELEMSEWEGLTKLDEERIFNRINQLFSQDVGFIIFNKTFVPHPEHHGIDMVRLRPRELSLGLTKKISEMAWGFVETEESGSFDYIFDCAREKFEQTLKSISEEGGGIYLDATRPHEGSEPESEEHLRIKWFLVKYLTQRLIENKQLHPKPDLLEIRNEIRTEKGTKEELDGPDGISADVKIGPEVYEVETLFAQDCEGKIPRKKITYTIEKYEGKSVRKINIVLDNLAFIRHIRDLIEIDRNFTSWQESNNIRIEFFTLDLRNSVLVSLQDMIREIRNITEEEAASWQVS